MAEAGQLPAQPSPLVINREIKSPGWGYLHARCKHGSSMSELYTRPSRRRTGCSTISKPRSSASTK